MKFYKTLTIGVLLLCFILPSFVSAQGFTSNTSSDFSSNTSSDFSSNTSCGKAPNGEFKLCNPLEVKNFCDLIKVLLNIVLAIGVPVAVLFLVWSGFRFILARGSQQGLADARRNFYYVIIGIAIFLGAWTLATVISATIQSLPGGTGIALCGRS